MILHRVKINRFGCLREYEASFAPGLNVIKGYNEAGKSTLHQALLMALIERPSRKKANEEYRSWGAERLFGLEIEYEVEGNGRWILAKDFETNNVRLQDPAGQFITQWDAVQEKLAVATGTVSPKLFRSTVCVSQDELSAIADGQKEIAQSLEQMVTGGTEDTYTSSVISKLDSVIQAYRRGCAVPAPKNPGPLAKLLSQEAERRKMVEDFQSQVSDVEEARERLVTIKARLAEIDGLLEPRLAAREEADAIRTLLDNLERCRRKENEIESTLARIADANLQLAEAKAQIAGLQRLADMSDEDLQACSRLKERVVLLTEQKASTERLPSSPTSEPKPRGTNLVHYILASSLLVAGIGAGAIGLLAGILTRNAGLGIILAGLGFVLFGVAVVWLVWLFLSTRRATPRPVMPAETKPDLNLQLAEAEPALADRLLALGCEDWTDYEAKRKQLQSALASCDNIQGRLDGLLPAGQIVETLETARKAASHERRDWEEKLSAPGAQRAAKMTPLEYQSLSTDVTRLVKEQEALEAEAVVKNAQVAAAKVTREDLLVAEERLAALEQEIEYTRERQEVYELAWQTLQTAREKTLVRARDRLAPLAGEYMKALTVGRYSELAVDSDLNVTIRSPDKAALNLVRSADLSKGTQDQLYLAMRLALIDLLFPSAKPPLFLDDPFVKFDVPRQRAAIGLCQTIARQRQVLLFTCRSDYDEAGRLIEIGERTG